MSEGRSAVVAGASVEVAASSAAEAVGAVAAETAPKGSRTVAAAAVRGDEVEARVAGVAQGRVGAGGTVISASVAGSARDEVALATARTGGVGGSTAQTGRNAGLTETPRGVVAVGARGADRRAIAGQAEGRTGCAGAVGEVVSRIALQTHGIVGADWAV